MHVGARECCGVVGLVMQTVNMAVQELANVRDAGGSPRMHGTVHQMEMGYSINTIHIHVMLDSLPVMC